MQHNARQMGTGIVSPGLSKREQALLMGFAVFFHATFMLSIIDMYFQSPVVHGMTPTSILPDTPAKRLVLFVGSDCKVCTLSGLPLRVAEIAR
jgi:hypothetical protein